MINDTAPILYSFRRCPYAMRARLALAISGTQCELREIKLSDKPEAMLAASPKGTVPVLILPSGRVIDQSIDIMRWALAQHDPENWLDRDDLKLINANDSAFKHHLDRYKYPERYGTDPDRHKNEALIFLHELDARIAGAGQLCGPERGLTDLAIAPFVRQFSAVDHAWFDEQPLPHLKLWLERHLASDLFATIMVRHAPWTLGNPPTLFPTAHTV